MERSETRRRLLKGVIAASALTLISPPVIYSLNKEKKEVPKVWYEPFILEKEDRYEMYKALGYVIEKDGKRYAANPLIPDKPLVYMKPYQEDRFELEPPGAFKLTERCIRCSLCYFACMKDGNHTIRLGTIKDGSKKVGVPIVWNLMDYPCTLCMSCAKACPTGALEEIDPKEVKMGIALIDPDLCWAWNSGDCYSCAKACPYGSEVFKFTFNEFGVHTEVIPERCTGCGQCIPACPVVGAAIHVYPKEVYEERVKSFKNTGMSYKEYTELIKKTENEDPEKATWRYTINADYIINKRGLIREKIVSQL